MTKRRRFKTALIVLGTIVTAGLLAAGTYRSAAGGVVTLYTSDGLEQYYSKVLPVFEKRYGLKVTMYDAGTGAVANRLTLEKDHPAADVAVQIPPFTQADAAKGLLESYTPAGAAAIPAAARDPHGRWYTFVGNVSSWIYNPSLVRKPPVTFNDLFDPQLHGRVAYSNPATAGDGQAVLLTLSTVWDKDRAFAFLKKLEPSVKFHTQGTSYLDVLVSRGEVLVANGDLQMDLSDHFNGGMNIKVAFLRPDSSSAPVALAEPYTISLVHGAPHKRAGEELVSFLLSKEAQAHVPDIYGIPARTDVPPASANAKAVAAELRGVKILYPDWGRVVTHLAAWNAEWIKDVAQAEGKQTNVKPPK